MNCSEFAPIITSGTQCASEFEMDERKSLSSRINILMHNLVIICTIVMTFMAASRMHTKNLFSKSTRDLLYCCMAFYILHDINFGFNINWSLFRGYFRENDECRIMFKGSECNFLYLFGIFSRILILFLQCFIAVERLFLKILPNSNFCHILAILIFDVIMSVIATSRIKPPSPSEFNSPNCNQQIFSGMETLKSFIWIMIFCVSVCFPINFGIMQKYRIKFFNLQHSHEYNLKSRYVYKNKMNASMIVSFVSFIQTVLFIFYIIALLCVLEKYTTESGLFYGNNVAMWFNIFPLAGLALPSSIFLSYSVISIKKNNKVGIMTTSSPQDAYFKSLASQWSTSRNSIF